MRHVIPLESKIISTIRKVQIHWNTANSCVKKRINWFPVVVTLRLFFFFSATGHGIDCRAMNLPHIRSICDQLVFGHRRVSAPAIWCQLYQPQRPMWKSIKTDGPIPLQRTSNPLSPAIRWVNMDKVSVNWFKISNSLRIRVFFFQVALSSTDCEWAMNISMDCTCLCWIFQKLCVFGNKSNTKATAVYFWRTVWMRKCWIVNNWTLNAAWTIINIRYIR